MAYVLSSTSIQQEPLTAELWHELRPLMLANHEAASIDAPFNGDFLLIQTLNPNIWVVRVDGEPFGYCAHVVGSHPFTGEPWAVCLAIYLDPAHRGMAKRLITQIEQDLAGEVAVINYSVPHLSNAGAFFETVMGYGCMELVMCKRLSQSSMSCLHR